MHLEHAGRAAGGEGSGRRRKSESIQIQLDYAAIQLVKRVSTILLLEAVVGFAREVTVRSTSSGPDW